MGLQRMKTGPHEGLICPACLQTTLRVSPIALDELPDGKHAQLQYHAECPCGLDVDRTADDEPASIRAILTSFVEKDLSLHAYDESAFTRSR